MAQTIAEALIEEGLEKGRKEGREKGREEWLIRGRIQMLESLLGLASSPIMKVGSQSLDELLRIEAELKAKLANRS